MDSFPLEFKDNIVHRPDSNVFDDEQSLGHLIIRRLTEAGNRIMIVNGLTDEKLTANQLVTRSIDVAKALLVAGIKPGDVVSVISENRFEFPYILFASIFLNCTCAPINATYSEKELNHAFSLSKPKFIFASNATIDKVHSVVKSLSYVKRLILIDNEPFEVWQGLTVWRDFTDPNRLLKVNFSPQSIDKSKSICLILCSSGTTGLPVQKTTSFSYLFQQSFNSLSRKASS